MRKSILAVMVLLFVGLVAANASASVVLYSSYYNFKQNTENRIVENFEDEVLAPGLTIISNSGAGVIADGVYQDIVNPTYGWTQTFAFDGLVYGFGAWLDLAGPGGEGTGITVSLLNNGQVIGEVSPTAEGQFWGFTSTEGFTGVVFSAGSSQGFQETYYGIDLVFTEPQPVPVPAAVWLLGSGLVGLVGLRRKLK